VEAMLAVNYTELRGNMKECMDKVSDDFETLIVTRKKNKNIVMISEETYNNMMENMHLIGNEENYKWLMESKRQLEEGILQMKELIEVSEDE
jgi:antitoxin YefM